MGKKKRHQLVFETPIWTSQVRTSFVQFNGAADMIRIKFDPDLKKEYDLIAGSEGLGSEFVFDIERILCEIDLDLNPFAVVDVVPIYMLEPVRDLIKAKSRPGNLMVKSRTKAPINATAVWLMWPFGTAILAFKGVVIAPTEKFAELLETIEVVEVGEGVTIGLDKEERYLRLVMVEGFQHRQKLEGIPGMQKDFVLRIMTEKECGSMFMEALNAIQLKYFEDPPPKEFKRFADRHLSKLERAKEVETELLEKLRKFAASRHRNLENLSSRLI